MDVDIEIVAKGRGLSFRRNTRLTKNDDEGIGFEVFGEPQECLLVLVPGMIKGEPDKKMPLLLYPDGTGEIALDFEEQDEAGNWKRIDIRTLR